MDIESPTDGAETGVELVEVLEFSGRVVFIRMALIAVGSYSGVKIAAAVLR